jgi:hypothetical protein
VGRGDGFRPRLIRAETRHNPAATGAR